MAGRLAKRLPASVRFDDLVSAGNLGLAQALCQRGESDGNGWSGYVSKRIWGAMIDELRATDPLTRQQRQVARRVDETARQLATALGRWPDQDEVSRAAQVSEESCRMIAARAQVRASDSIDGLNPVCYAGGSSGRDEQATAEDAAIHRQEAEHIISSVERLPPRLRMVVSLYFEDGLTLREIGERMEITEPRVHQLRNEAIALLRRWCAPHGTAPGPEAHASL
jgi:RNA polymerase sigma factor for flagellar operon FliA